MSDGIGGFAALLGDGDTLTGPDHTAPYVTDTRDRLSGAVAAVLRPRTVAQVQAVVAHAHRTRTAIIPQGGNTGLVGAGLPRTGGAGDEIIVSLARLDTIRNVDTASNTMTAEAGCILQTLQETADAADRLFPLSLGAKGSCRIGGNIASNAGGTGTLAYGNTRDLVLGLEVVLPDGRLWNGLSKLRKDNTGYDLKNLFVGAEGTLGIVTAATLKLFPKPRGRGVAFVGLASPDDALRLLSLMQAQAAGGLTGFELMSRRALDFTLRHTPGARAPLTGTHAWTALVEISSMRGEEDAAATLEAALSAAFERGAVEDATIAASGQQAADFWKLREDMSWAQKPEGASIKHDIAVPIDAVPAFCREADAAVARIVPGARIVNFGHLGDGNLHYNVSRPEDWTDAAFFELEEAVHDAVYERVVAHGGSISAEHGIGQIKRERLAAVKDPVALALMRQIKATLDPHRIMNPGKVV